MLSHRKAAVLAASIALGFVFIAKTQRRPQIFNGGACASQIVMSHISW